MKTENTKMLELLRMLKVDMELGATEKVEFETTTFEASLETVCKAIDELKIIDSQQSEVDRLRDSGHIVIIWTPEELEGCDARAVEERSIERGHEVIEDTQE